jgi:hypothetical protein
LSRVFCILWLFLKFCKLATLVQVGGIYPLLAKNLLDNVLRVLTRIPPLGFLQLILWTPGPSSIVHGFQLVARGTRTVVAPEDGLEVSFSAYSHDMVDRVYTTNAMLNGVSGLEKENSMRFVC